MSPTKFLDKTLLAIARVAEQALFSEAYARKRGLLQALDVRIKLLSFLSILVLASFLRTPQALWMMYGLSLVLAISSRVSIVFFLKRVCVSCRCLGGHCSAALLNIITPGETVWTIMTLDHPHVWGSYVIPREIAVTRQGLWGSIIFISRVATSVSFAVLLTLTTKWAEIFSGLRSLFVPRIFVVTLSMTERYIFVLLRLIQDVYRGRMSRTINPDSLPQSRGTGLPLASVSPSRNQWK